MADPAGLAALLGGGGGLAVVAGALGVIREMIKRGGDDSEEAETRAQHRQTVEDMRYTINDLRASLDNARAYAGQVESDLRADRDAARARAVSATAQAMMFRDIARRLRHALQERNQALQDHRNLRELPGLDAADDGQIWTVYEDGTDGPAPPPR